MRRLKHQVHLAAVVSLLLGVVMVSAQTSTKLVGDIPFDFHVGQTTLPSGQYTVKFGYPTAGVICIQSQDGARSAMTQTISLTPGKQDGVAKLVFNQYGTSYFLSQAWNPSHSIARGVLKTKAEMEVARNARNPQATVVALEKR